MQEEQYLFITNMHIFTHHPCVHSVERGMKNFEKFQFTQIVLSVNFQYSPITRQ